MLRDVCILPDTKSGTYYMIGPGRRASVVQYTSKDLINWYGPKTIFQTPDHFWGDTPIQAVWAPELHAYKGKYYLFQTFSTGKELAEQWLNWRPRVVRGSQILVSDSATGPFRSFRRGATTSPGTMTLRRYACGWKMANRIWYMPTNGYKSAMALLNVFR